ncbi:MAG: SHOCT domain-containing protein [Candidatus Methylacidiphilales bacterium]|nr:hypothetical protein [Candidatus Methylacidiphilales bacterium]
MSTATMSQTSSLQALANQHGFSLDAVQSLYNAIERGGGSMAQFNHHELGGNGQWMSGGMMMIGDMFNNNLKNRVASLAQDLSNAYYNQPPQQESQNSGNQGSSSFSTMSSNNNNWWPSEFGHPASSGGQNDLSYAHFPDRDRLAIRMGSNVSIFDTQGLNIGGFSQQQSNGLQGLYVSTNRGQIAVTSLPRVQ